MRKTEHTRRTDGEDEKKQVSKGAVARFLVLIVVCVLTVLIYRVLLETPAGFYVFVGYMAAATVLIFTYVIYNRGFSRRGLTEEMLPDTMSAEEKKEFIESGKRRMKRSSWMLIPIIALLLTFLLEILETTVLPTLTGWFS